MAVTYRKTITPQAVDRDGICLAQTISGTDDLLLNGTLVTGGVATFTNATHVSVYSTSDLSESTFTITGTDRYGAELSEAIAGPNNTTVATTKNFLTVTNVQRSDSVDATIEVGTYGAFETPWVPLSTYAGVWDATCAVEVSAGASLTYAMQYTPDRVMDVGEHAAIAFDDATITGKTDDFAARIAVPAAAVRIKVTGYTAGTITPRVVQFC